MISSACDGSNKGVEAEDDGDSADDASDEGQACLGGDECHIELVAGVRGESEGLSVHRGVQFLDLSEAAACSL